MRVTRQLSRVWPIQDIVLFLGLCARTNTIICAPTLCLGTPPHPVIAHTIAHYNVSPRPPVIAIYTTHYWQWKYLVKANLELTLLTGSSLALRINVFFSFFSDSTEMDSRLVIMFPTTRSEIHSFLFFPFSTDQVEG